MKKFFMITIAAAFILAGAYFFVAQGSFLAEKDVSFGVTFSSFMARQLEIDPEEAFAALADDLAVKKIRLPVYWQYIEPERGVFDFSLYDRLMKKAEEEKLELILVVGRKLPRWPECHRPEWSRELSEAEFEEAVLAQIRAIVERYRSSPAVAVWQVENEPFHVFGAECASGKIKAEYLDRELALVKSLDSRPVMLTDAGKAGMWFTSLWKGRADIVGITMYYQVWNQKIGVWHSTFGPGLFWLKRLVIRPFFLGKKIIDAELQAEPFGAALLPDYDISLQKELMNPDVLRDYVLRARRSGFDEHYLWGVEWWYWLKKVQNDPSMWEEAKTLFIK